MIADKIQDQQLKQLEMQDIKHPSAVTSEALSVISKLKTPDNGLEMVKLTFHRLDEKVSETVLN